MADFSVAILTSSDMAAKGDREDTSGDLAKELIEASGGRVVARAVLPDEREALATQLKAWSDSGEVGLILTTGGTGLGPRDVTPEATLDVAERLVPGLAEQMRAQTVAKMQMAISATRESEETKNAAMGGHFTEKLWALDTKMYRPDPTTLGD